MGSPCGVQALTIDHLSKAFDRVHGLHYGRLLLMREFLSISYGSWYSCPSVDLGNWQVLARDPDLWHGLMDDFCMVCGRE